jgi:MFS family permease
MDVEAKTLEWRANWTIVLAAFAGMAVSTINAYSIGVFMQPLQDAFGWSRAQISFGQVLNAIVCVLLSPFAGALADRVGPRWIGLTGLIVLCALTASLGLTGPSIYSWWAVFGLISFANVCVVPMIWTSAITARFNEARGLALAATLSGAGLGSLVTPVLSVFLIEHFGWRLAFPALAGFWVILAAPLVYLFLHNLPRDSAVSRSQSTRIRLSSIVQSDLLTWRFLRLGAATLSIAIVAVSFAALIVPILTSRGLDREQAAGVASILGISAIVGRLTVGALLDRIEARLVSSLAVLSPIITCLILIAMPASVPGAVIAVIFLGLALGAELDAVSYLTSRMFNPAHFGMIFGTIISFVTLAGGFGPFLMNIVFDLEGSYLPALQGAILLCGMSSLLFWSLGPISRVQPQPVVAA